MPTETNKLALLNSALRMVGSYHISGDDESSTTYEIASRAYTQAVTELFGDNSFNYNTKRVVLTGEVATDFSEYQYKYTLPNDFNVFLLVENSNDFLVTEYRFANGNLYSSESILKLTYTYVPSIETSAAGLPKFLTRLLTLHMAQNMCIELSGSDERHELLAKQYTLALHRARTLEGRQGPAQEYVNDALRMVGNHQKEGENDTDRIYESGTSYEIASRAYVQAINEIFGNNSFNFNTKRVSLTGVVSSEFTEHQYEFELPADFNTFLIIEKTNDFLLTDYRFANEKLYCSEINVKLTYTFIPLFEAASFELPSFLRSLLTLHMAQSISLEITGSAERHQLLYGEYLRALDKARILEGRQGPSQKYLNDALRMVGSYQRQSENETSQVYDSSTTYEIASRSYSQAITEIFGNNSFNFNTKRVSLAGAVSSEFTEHQYEFELPADFNTFLIIEKTNDFLLTDYRFANEKLYCSEINVKLTYTFIPLFEAASFELPSFLRSLLTLHMAQSISLEITGSAERHQLLYGEYLRALDKARILEGRQGPSQKYLNDALRMVGSYQRQSESETSQVYDSSTTYEIASRSYSQAITEIFGNNSFNFNTKRVTLTGTTSVEFSDFGYEFELPADYNTFLIIETANDFLATDYRFANGKLYYSDSTLKLTYTFIPLFETPSFELPPFLRSLLTLHMAQNMALEISGSAERHQLLFAEYLRNLRKARSLEARQGPSQKYLNDALRMVGGVDSVREDGTDKVSDSGTTYEMARRSYTQAVAEIFGDNIFNYNTKLVTLTGVESLSFKDYKYEYTLPLDLNILLKVESLDDYLVTDYRLINGKLYSSEASLKVTHTYVPSLTEIDSTLPAFLARTLVLHMAQNLVIVLAGSENPYANRRYETLANQYTVALRRARTLEGRQGPAQTYINDGNSQFISAHQRYGSI